MEYMQHDFLLEKKNSETAEINETYNLGPHVQHGAHSVIKCKVRGVLEGV